MVKELDSTIVAQTDLPFGYIALRKDGILHTHFNLEMEISLHETKLVYQKAFELTKGKSYPNLFTATTFMLPDKETREFMVSKERLALTSADAMVLSSMAQKILGNFYLKINQPPIPTKFFSNVDDALVWLKSI